MIQNHRKILRVIERKATGFFQQPVKCGKMQNISRLIAQESLDKKKMEEENSHKLLQEDTKNDFASNC